MGSVDAASGLVEAYLHVNGYLTLSEWQPNMIAGVVIAFSESPIYSHYEAMPRIWGMSVMADQRLAGVIMWVPGSMMYMIFALILAARWLKKEEEKPPLPESKWATDEAMIAPGMEKR
jgi:cytochrome c oxidase assembly factor CtaG